MRDEVGIASNVREYQNNSDYINSDSQLQNILDYSFQEYYNNDNRTDQNYNRTDQNYNMDEYVDREYDRAKSISDSKLNILNSIFRSNRLKVDECSICTETKVRIKCYSCVGYLCKDCIVNIYKHNNGNLKCPYCQNDINIHRLKRSVQNSNRTSEVHNKNRNRNIESNNSNMSNIIHSSVSCSSSNKQNCIKEQTCSNEDIKYIKSNIRKYNDSDYDSNSERNDCSYFTDKNSSMFSNLSNKNNNNNKFKTYIYNHKFIKIESFCKNKIDIELPLKFYNCKYIFILYKILIKMIDNQKWNNFALLLMNKIRTRELYYKNYKKKFLWCKYLEYYNVK